MRSAAGDGCAHRKGYDVSIRITHIRLTGAVRRYEHISDLFWVSESSDGSGSITRADLVTWIDQAGIAYVGTGPQRVRVETVHPAGSAAYVRTAGDATSANNLLALPLF